MTWVKSLHSIDIYFEYCIDTFSVHMHIASSSFEYFLTGLVTNNWQWPAPANMAAINEGTLKTQTP
jgi:hypothetical protein